MSPPVRLPKTSVTASSSRKSAEKVKADGAVTTVTTLEDKSPAQTSFRGSNSLSSDFIERTAYRAGGAEV